MFSTFYHSSIRKVTLAFSTLFNNLYIVRTKSDGTVDKKFKVPIDYSAREKWIHTLNLNIGDASSHNLETSLPRMTFEILDIQYDGSRKNNNLMKRVQDVNDQIVYNFAAVPYDIVIRLSIFTRTMDDGLQIVEQILPFFTPRFNVVIKPGILKDEDEKTTIPFVLNSTKPTVLYEGNQTEEKGGEVRAVVWDLFFTAKTMLYGPVKTGGLIKEIDINLYEGLPE